MHKQKFDKSCLNHFNKRGKRDDKWTGFIRFRKME